LCQDDQKQPKPQPEHSGTLTPEGSVVLRPQSAACSIQYAPVSDALEGVEARYMQLVPILEPSALSKGNKDSGRARAVLQLVNKQGSQSGQFSFVDEYLLMNLGKHVAYAFEMAWCAPGFSHDCPALLHSFHLVGRPAH
jgi:hypothetical protein